MVVLDNTKAETTLATSEDARRLRLSIDVMSDALNSLALESSKATNAQIDDVYRLLGAAQSFLAQSTLASKRLDEYLEFERTQDKTTSEEKPNVASVSDEPYKTTDWSEFLLFFIVMVVVLFSIISLSVSSSLEAIVFWGSSSIISLCVLYGFSLRWIWDFIGRIVRKRQMSRVLAKQPETGSIR